MNEIEAQQRISGELRAAGLRPGGVALVHSSLKSLGHVPGGPETVIRGLLDALGPRGTLLLPALSFKFVDAAHPVFDVLRTPSCIGAVAEYFRTRPGTIRSVHPTHSVCGVGPVAGDVLRDHIHDDTPCGSHSPYRALRDRGGQIFFLGCGMRPNTSMHGVEELAGPPYLFGATIAYRVILSDGREIALSCRRHHFQGWSQRYDRLGPLLSGDELRTATVLQATVHIVECRAMWEKALAALRQDPFFFVEKNPSPPVRG
jgi:aminoglycoside 3-N-acetyltransferase